MSPPKFIRLRTFIVVAACALFGWFTHTAWKYTTIEQLESQTSEALRSGNYAEARSLAMSLLRHHADSIVGQRAIARASWKLQRVDAALALYDQLLRQHADLAAIDYFALGEIMMQENDPIAAEQYLRLALARDEDLHVARRSLLKLLSIECRHEEAVLQRQQLLLRGVWTTQDLMDLAKPGDVLVSEKLDAFLSEHPNEAYLLLGKARQALIHKQYASAQRWLDQTLAANPEFVEAHADQGLLLLKREAAEHDFIEWHTGLPKEADRHATVWMVRGTWAMRCRDPSGAARCLAEAVLRHPDNLVATHQLSLALAELGDEAVASQFADRVGLLGELEALVLDFHETPHSTERWEQAAELLVLLGRLPEAAAWYRNIARLRETSAAERKAREFEARVSRNTPLITAETNPILKLETEQFALPTFDGLASSVEGNMQSGPSVIRFVNVAASAGMDFNFIGSDLPVSRDRRPIEVMGSGIGVVDFDQDGWPDIYFAQGSPAESVTPDEEYRDRLFRNVGDGRFVDVTSESGLGDRRFSQGVAVGDFNNDGFPDILLGNIGPNRLYQNNGDGTFEDVTAASGITGDCWTSSMAMADLNGDSLPDIFEVNYLSNEVFAAHCVDPNGKKGACMPRHFPAVPDRCFLNQGDGRFVDKSRECGIVASDGRGLGVVAADFDGDGKLSVFVTNDMSANYFYTNQASRREPPRFVDRAVLAGLGYDFDGYPQACMGIATHDADADGRLDLFVTNYYGEANTFYRANGTGSFEDASRQAGLHQPSLPLLGFGTEFLDADLDGDSDLVVANGHVGDDGAGGLDFQMRPQLFENQGGRFVERTAPAAGDYFGRKMLGRSLACLDFDRDGRPDFAVSHLDVPAALLRNETSAAGHYLAVRVRGVENDRDAIGTTITVVRPNGQRCIGQVTAGDGFMCSNQRQLVFGLGDATIATKLIVQWMSGVTREFVNVAADREWLVIEGREELVEVPH